MRRLRHSPGTARLSETLREIAEIVAIVAIAAAIGVAAGKGLSALTGDGKTSQPASGFAATPLAAPAPSVSAKVTVRVKVLYAGLRPLAAGAGEPSDRSRLRVGLRLRNDTDRRVTIDVQGLQVGQSLVRADDSDGLDGRFGKGLDARAAAKDELHFSTGAGMTRQLVRLRRATLLIAGRRVAVRFDVASAPAQDDATTTTSAVP